MNRVLIVVAFASFVSSLFIRMTDPLVPLIAADMAVETSTAALLGTAFALPWALMQPILGPLGDLLGKTRVILVCMSILFVGAMVGAFAESFPVLVIARVISGAAAGGVFPVSMAVYGDMVPVAQRQVGMGRLLTASISGMLMGGALAGILADFVPWRWIFVIFGTGVAVTLAVAIFALRKVPISPPRPLQIAAMVNNYRQVWSNPLAKVCYGAVFLEGIVLVGLFPFVAVLLVSIGEPRPSIAGVILAAFPLGGVIYALTVNRLVSNFSIYSLMIFGGGAAAAMLLVQAFVPPWPVQVAVFFVMGFGFYLLHGCIIVQMTELAPDARGTATAGHALAYFSGQAIGPIVYALGFAAIGPSPTIVVAAVIMALIGYVSARLLHGGKAQPT